MFAKPIDIEKELKYLGLLEKSREIYFELGKNAALSYIKSSHRLLSKVYHPDLNPINSDKAKITQQRLNRLSSLLGKMTDDQLIRVLLNDLHQHAHRKKKILVVEDEFGLQEIFRDVLMMEGYHVRTAVDGEMGYGIYCQFEPDLILTDVIMPKINGLELIRTIRRVNDKIKVIYMSGFMGIKPLKKELDEEIITHGYPTLSKPFKISILLDLVGKYLKTDVRRPLNVNLFV